MADPTLSASPSMGRFGSMGRPRVLQILHGGTGGLGVAVDLLEQQTGDRFEHWCLGVEAGCWRVLGRGDGAGERLFLRDAGALRRLVRRLGVDLVHVHHILGDRRHLARALRRLPIPYGVTVHDFYFACPRIHMVPPGQVYCDAPTILDRCRECLARDPCVPVDIADWRQEHGELLRGAAFVTTPTADTARVVMRYWPDLQPRVVPHDYRPRGLDTPIEPDPDEPFSVGVVGALGPEKGGEMVERLAEAARARDLPLRLVVLGDTHRHGGPQSLMEGWLFVHGSYRREELPRWLREYRIRLAAFPAIWPETFCLTLSETWASRVPALVPAFGALAERVNAAQGGWTVAEWTQPAAWLDAILRHARDPEALAAAGERGCRSLLPGYTRHPVVALYAEAMASPEAGRG